MLIFVIYLTGCWQTKPAPVSTGDANTAVPTNDPDFTSLSNSWVIDNADLMKPDKIVEASQILQKLQDDKVAEVVIIIQPDVKKPADWSTHYGRWLKLGSKGYSTEGGNNGLVWLIRPDANEKMYISVGRGLPKFTATDYGKVMDAAKDYINFGNYNKGIVVIARETSLELRKLYGKNKTGEKR